MCPRKDGRKIAGGTDAGPPADAVEFALTDGAAGPAAGGLGRGPAGPGDEHLWARIFPYTPRQGQAGFMELWGEACGKGGHLVMECGTGSGKTICAAAPALASALTDGRRVLYLTRTNSQQRQALLEVRAMVSYGGVPGFDGIPACGIQGRAQLCPVARSDPRLSSGDPEELSQVCSEMKRAALGVLKGGTPSRPPCQHYLRLCTAELEPVLEWMAAEVPSPEELSARCAGMGLCPYELTKLAVEKAAVVTAPYIFFFSPFIRRHLLEWMGCSLEDLVVVVDEAHNLPGYLRDLASSSLGMRGLKLALKEAGEFSLPPLSGSVEIKDLISLLARTMAELVEEYLIDVDGLVPAGELEARLMSGLRVTSHGLKQVSRDLVNDGEVVRDKKRKLGHLPRSYIRSLGLFLDRWMEMESSRYVQLVLGRSSSSRRMMRQLSGGLRAGVSDGGDRWGAVGEGLPGGPVAGPDDMGFRPLQAPEFDDPAPAGAYHDLRLVLDGSGHPDVPGPAPSSFQLDLAGVPGAQPGKGGRTDPLLERLARLDHSTGARLEAFCLDPSVLAAPLQDAHATLHMSGTLWPLEEYRDVMDLPLEAALRVIPSPFPPKNKLTLYTTDVTTKYEEMERRPGMEERIAVHLEKLLNGSRRNTLVLFPSFEMLDRFVGGGLLAGVRRERLVDERGTGQAELMELARSFCESRGAVLFSVCGGRLSEGMDYPAQELEMVVVVGIPYPPPTARQRALSYFHDVRFGKGWEYTVTAPTARKLVQGVGRLIRRPDDRGAAVILDKRARHFHASLDGLLQSWDPARDVRRFFGEGEFAGE